MNLKPIHEQVVVVVGATSGVGRETALRLAALGAKVVVSGCSVSALAELVQEIRWGREWDLFSTKVSKAYQQLTSKGKPVNIDCHVQKAGW